jgi:hypothetical protein
MNLRVLRGEAIAPLEWIIASGTALGLVAMAAAIASRLYHREALAASS